MNDVLLPVCRNLGIKLIPAGGFASITRAIELLQPAARPAKLLAWLDAQYGAMLGSYLAGR